MSTTLQTTTQTVEGIINGLAPIVATLVPQAAPVVAGIEAAETVANTVEANLPHNTAVSDIAAGLNNLASTSLVQGNPVAAAKVTGLALLFKDFLGFVEGIKL